MLILPSVFKNDNEDYLTSIEIKKFLKIHGEKVTFSEGRMEVVEKLINYANLSEENVEKVQDWVDKTTKEGIKYIYIKKVNKNSPGWNLVKSGVITALLNELLEKIENKHLCNSMDFYEKDAKLIRADILESEHGEVISLYFCKKIHIYDRTKIAKESLYPVYVDIYTEHEIVVVRGKSKSGMYIYRDEGFDYDVSKSTEVSKCVGEIFNYISDKLGIWYVNSRDVNIYFRQKFYNLLNKYTDTPEIIKDKMSEKSMETSGIINFFVENICNLDDKYKVDVEKDIINLVEKYFSISYPEKNIFKEGRDAFPLKIIATDEEDSHLEQATGTEEPLQSRAIFFDNKKMMQKSRLCDGVVFVFNRRNPTKYNPNFKVTIITNKDYCTLKFTEYIKEEDIQYVLFSVIDVE
ncbi:hypothetical protein NO348_05610 [Hungatella hathewayi]|uniref:hypothetical protein n=1 Tax=Hungatella hathewayi TaxID=154046 RepID=UPI00210B74D2|nr:hypothetical protein [Hungatella hathewayi]MCQ5384288.1 hypothetical protein [Hungatella hathewayi]